MLDIGKNVLKANSKDSNPVVRGTRGRDAVKWLQKAFSLSEALEGSESISTRQLRVSQAQLYSIAALELTWNASDRGASCGALVRVRSAHHG